MEGTGEVALSKFRSAVEVFIRSFPNLVSADLVVAHDFVDWLGQNCFSFRLPSFILSCVELENALHLSSRLNVTGFGRNLRVERDWMSARRGWANL